MSFFRSRAFWVIVFCVLLGIGYWGWTEVTGKNLNDLFHIKKQQVNHIEPITPIDNRVAQPSVVDQSGTRVDYNRRESSTALVKSTPTPIPQPDKVEITPIVLVDSSDVAPTPTPVPKPADPAPTTEWLPEGRFIPCVLSNEIDSGHTTVPIILIVTENIYQQDEGKGRLIIRAGSKLMSFGNWGRYRDRITSDGEWRCIFIHEGTSVSFDGVLCDMEYDPSSNQYGLYDKSPGIMGKVIDTQQLLWVRGLFGTLFSTFVGAAGQIGNSALQRGTDSTNINIDSNALPNAATKYIDMMVQDHAGDVNDSVYVQVPAFKQCWVCTKSPLEPGKRSIGARVQTRMRAQPPEAKLQNTQESTHETAGHFGE